MIDRRAVTLGLATLAATGGAAPSVNAAEPDLAAVLNRARELDQLHALVIRRGGTALAEIAPRGPGLDAPANVKSVSKTLVALLTGIAIERRHIDGPDQRVLPILGRAPFGDARDDLTVGDLLSMRTGLESTSGPRYGPWVGSADWMDYALTRDLVGEPGGRFVYSTGGWHILGAALSRATGRSLLDLGRDWLAEPLGIALPPWQRDPQGRYMGGNQMALSPRALARIGDMVRSGGRWEGRQVVPSAWIGHVLAAARALALVGGGLRLWLVPGAPRRAASGVWAGLWRAGPGGRARSRSNDRDHVRPDAAGAIGGLFRRPRPVDGRHGAGGRGRPGLTAMTRGLGAVSQHADLRQLGAERRGQWRLGQPRGIGIARRIGNG